MIWLLIISQLVFSFTRTLNVRYTSKDRVLMSIITSTIIKATWLLSTYIGVTALMDGSILTCLVYVCSGVLGDWLSFKVKIK